MKHYIPRPVSSPFHEECPLYCIYHTRPDKLGILFFDVAAKKIILKSKSAIRNYEKKGQKFRSTAIESIQENNRMVI